MRLFHDGFAYLVKYECKSRAAHDHESSRFATGARRRLGFTIYRSAEIYRSLASVDKKQLHTGHDHYAADAPVQPADRVSAYTQ